MDRWIGQLVSIERHGQALQGHADGEILGGLGTEVRGERPTQAVRGTRELLEDVA